MVIIAGAAAGAAAARASRASEQMQAVSSCFGSDIYMLASDLGVVRELRLPYIKKHNRQIPDKKELDDSVWDDTEEAFAKPIQESEILIGIIEIFSETIGEKVSAGLFRSRIIQKKIQKRKIVFLPLSEALVKLLPDDAIVLNLVFDWYNSYIRVFFSTERKGCA